MNKIALNSIDGAHDLERDDISDFVWTKKSFELTKPGSISKDLQYVLLEVASPHVRNTLRVEHSGRVSTVALRKEWQKIDVGIGNAEHLAFEVDSAQPVDGDDRELGVMVRTVAFHNDADLHRVIATVKDNKAKNDEEFAEGRMQLRSFPPHLRITVSKTCNIAEALPCAYCSWDWAKAMEKDSPDHDFIFIRDLGGFIEAAVEVTDCSYGEPPLEKDFSRIVDYLATESRTLEFTSNGQSLSRKKRQAVLGKNIRLYVSIDAPGAEGYQRYRDHRFQTVIGNLTDLCREKKGHDDLPFVIVSYIVMRSNVDEIREFLRLMREVGVDRVVFRALHKDADLPERTVDHYGYSFDYDSEYLNPDELETVRKSCMAHGREVGVPVTVEWQAFCENSGGRQQGEPLCSEPWKTAYIMNRGLTPCCFGREALVGWESIDRSHLESSLRAAINSEPFVELRRDLAAGRLGEYCRGAPACPIVKSHIANGEGD